MNEWFKKYACDTFTIIGVHTPEFEREMNLSSVREQIKRLKIQSSG